MENHLEELTEKRRMFFNDFIGHYNSANRGTKDGDNNCCYSAGCAIGRVIEKELAKSLDEEEGNPSVSSIFCLLPNDLQELGKDFLQDIQFMHDASNNWWPNGLSPDGEDNRNKLKEIWSI